MYLTRCWSLRIEAFSLASATRISGHSRFVGMPHPADDHLRRGVSAPRRNSRLPVGWRWLSPGFPCDHALHMLNAGALHDGNTSVRLID